ncbi:MAG TPA: TonB-dependent receptor [Burkholderiaceae bacterium]|nr:TonB-dependent receptor [Burkholderiaceae bacterium]
MTFRRGVRLACVLMTTGAIAHAQQPAPTALDSVVVTGSRVERASFDLPFAVTSVDAETLRAAGPMVNLSEALVRVPGLTVNNRNNYAQDLQISSRGFGARAGFGVRGIRLYTDGIPAAMPDGQGQVTHFNLASAQRIEVLRGPFSALYGNSSGGVIALFSREPQSTRADAAFDAGADGMRQIRLSGEARIGERASGLVDASHFQTDGFRPHSEADRDLAFARLGYADRDDRVIVTASQLAQRADDPLGLTRAQFNQNPYQTTSQATQFDTRKDARQTQVGANWRRSLGDGVLREAGFTLYGGQRGVTQWQSIPVSTQSNAAHPGGVIDFDRDYSGADARLSMRVGPVGLIIGTAYETQDEARRGYENFIGSGAAQRLGVTGRLRRDEDNTVRSFDQYAQAEWAFDERWTATAGVRHGRTRFASNDRYLINGDDSGARSFGYTNPVAGLVFHASDAINLYASVGRGYEAPTLNELSYRADGGSGFNDTLSAQKSRQGEIGAKFKLGGARVDLAAFIANTDDEIVVRSNVGGRSTFGNAGRTRRQGAELALTWPFAPGWRMQAALAVLDATYRDAFATCASTPCVSPTLVIPAGNRIPGTAERTAFVDVGWTPLKQTAFGVEWRGVSSVAVNDANTESASGYGVLALRAEQRAEFGPWRLRMYARVDNALDKTYAGSVIVNEGNARFFETGAPRTWLVGVSAGITL